MTEHEELLLKIRRALEKNLEKTFIEFHYEYEKQIFFIDILSQKGGKIFLFECKKKGKRNKAEKQLYFHKKALEEAKKRLYWTWRLLPFSEVQLFYVSEEENKVINIETNKETLLDPLFLDDPLSFLEEESL